MHTTCFAMFDVIYGRVLWDWISKQNKWALCWSIFPFCLLQCVYGAILSKPLPLWRRKTPPVCQFITYSHGSTSTIFGPTTVSPKCSGIPSYTQESALIFSQNTVMCSVAFWNGVCVCALHAVFLAIAVRYDLFALVSSPKVLNNVVSIIENWPRNRFPLLDYI